MGKARAWVAAMKHRNPTKSVKLIAVAGPYGKTTTILLLSEVLRESGKSVLALTNHGIFHDGVKIGTDYDSSADAAQKQLALARSKKVDFVIIEVTTALTKTQILPTLTLEMSLITGNDDNAQKLLGQPVEYTVVPSGLDMSGQAVAPHQAISYGDDVTAEAQIKEVTLLRKGTEIELIVDHQTKFELATYLVGKANVRNIAAAVSAAYVLSADMSTLQDGIARLESAQGNFEYLLGGGAVAVDGAVSEQSLELVLSSAKTIRKRRLLVALDASIPESAYSSSKQYCDRLIVVGQVDKPGIESAESPEAALGILKRAAKKDDLVLLVGRDYAARQDDGRSAAELMVEAGE